MRFHESIVKKIIYLCANFGGHTSETKLKSQIENIRLSTHIDSDGKMFLVDTQLLINERTQRKIPIGDIIPMVFHPSVVLKLMKIYEMYSGHNNEKKLYNALTLFDLTPYERVINGNDVVLVTTEEYIKILQSVGRKG